MSPKILITLFIMLCATDVFGSYYGYVEREFTFREKATHVGVIYAVSWGTYPVFQKRSFAQDGSFTTYRENFGKLTFDRDGPFWNLFVHSVSGSQLYLIYRALGYSQGGSMGMVLINSVLFEFFTEIYTEPASVQDLYHTPVLGSALGYSLEKFSMYLLNTGNYWAKILARMVNPATLFWFYEGKTAAQVVPHWDGKKSASLTLIMSF